MTRFWRNNAPLVGAVGLSLVAHALLLALHLTPSNALAENAAGGSGDAAGDEDLVRREFMEPDNGALDTERAKKLIEHAKERRRRLAELPPPIPVDHEEPVRLGIDESNAQTMNWIGYEEYQEHLAELAEVEQAAFRMRVASGAEGTAPTGLPPVEPTPSTTQAAQATLAATAPGNTAPSTANVEGADASTETPPITVAIAPVESVEATKPIEAIAAIPAVAPSDSAETITREGSDAVTPDTTSPIKSVDTPSSLPSEGEHTVPLPPLLDPLAHPSPENPTEPPVEPVDAVAAVEAIEAVDAVVPVPAANEVLSTEATKNATAGTADPNASPIEAKGSAEPAITPTEATGLQPTQPSPQGKPSDIISREGAISDRESDATSTIDVPSNVWRSGRPLATKGQATRLHRAQHDRRHRPKPNRRTRHRSRRKNLTRKTRPLHRQQQRRRSPHQRPLRLECERQTSRTPQTRRHLHDPHPIDSVDGLRNSKHPPEFSRQRFTRQEIRMRAQTGREPR